MAWNDSRNGTVELPTEDAYFAKVIHDEPGAEVIAPTPEMFPGGSETEPLEMPGGGDPLDFAYLFQDYSGHLAPGT